MIIGPDFVWLHFPKCAGSETEHVLRRVFSSRRDLQFDPIDFRNVIWHHTIAQREQYDATFRVGSRAIICGIRRLPFWLLSRIHFERVRSSFRVTREMFLKGAIYEQTGEINKADSYMLGYSRPAVTHWIRVESIQADLQRVFSLYAENDVVIHLNASEYRNKNAIPYIRELEFYFTPAELTGLYEANPVWARIEKAVYGDILTL